MNRLAAEQMRRNRLREGEWDLAASHRRQVTGRLVSLAPAEGRLCVLGAGNSNDLELPKLLRAYKEIHLVDLDDEALARGVGRQMGEPAGGLYLHGGIDLTGIAEALSSRAATSDWRNPATDDPLSRADDPGPFPLPGPFDVVASTGVLSQLIEAVTSTVPADTPWLWQLLLAVRTGHPRLAARLTAPGGNGLLVSDFVSSATCQELARLTEAELAELVPRFVAAQNFFHGLNPLFVPSLFASDPVLRTLIDAVTPCGYWLWHQTARTYAVFAVQWRRSTAAGD